MCGIAGFISSEFVGAPQRISETLVSMTSRLTHRGPDGQGIWADDEHGVGLGHTRLSILDLSEAGSQPMSSSCGRIVITFNGEIYNADQIRSELQTAGRRFRGSSDTEVLVEACAEFGLNKAVQKCIGMFAFALWDRQQNRLFLVRDRLGKKPLYFSHSEKELVFASELSAFHPFKPWERNIDRHSLAAFLVFGYVPDPRSIYEGISKLEPGHIATFDLSGDLTIEPFWSLDDVVFCGNDPSQGGQLGDAAAIATASGLLTDSVQSRLKADVPVGIFLSGGLDSTIVAAVAANTLGGQRTHTFSIGFEEHAFNEADDARRIAKHLGTRHHELYVSAKDALECIPKLSKIYDEPFADSSQVPTYLLSKMARENISVALSGDGGDEAFGGYNRYLMGDKINRFNRLMPKCGRSALSTLMQAVSPELWDHLFGVLPKRFQVKNAGDKLHKLASVIPLDNVGIYRQLLSQWPDAYRAVPGANDPYITSILHDRGGDRIEHFPRWMRYLDTLNYLPNDILTKVDRASMAVSLEVRCPLLDQRIIEFSWSLSNDQLIRKGKTKWILRQILAQHCPPEMFDRPKMGFGIPLADWLRGPLRDWCEDLLQKSALLKSGMLDPDPILVKWAEHKSGSRNWQYALWNILMFQSWWMDRSGPWTPTVR